MILEDTSPGSSWLILVIHENQHSSRKQPALASFICEEMIVSKTSTGVFLWFEGCSQVVAFPSFRHPVKLDGVEFMINSGVRGGSPNFLKLNSRILLEDTRLVIPMPCPAQKYLPTSTGMKTRSHPGSTLRRPTAFSRKGVEKRLGPGSYPGKVANLPKPF